MKLDSWQQWKKFLVDQHIEDEYGHEVPYQDFVNLVENDKAPSEVNHKHNSGSWYNPEYDWDDEEGYSFTNREFS